ALRSRQPAAAPRSNHRALSGCARRATAAPPARDCRTRHRASYDSAREAGMEHEEGVVPTPAGEPARRVRFVAMRGREPATLLRFHPRITVLSGFGDGFATWLAGALARGPMGTPEGFAEVSGERIALSALPAEVYDAGECPVIDAAAIEHDLQ